MSDVAKIAVPAHDATFCVQDYAFTFEWECKRCGLVWPVNTPPPAPCTQEQSNG